LRLFIGTVFKLLKRKIKIKLRFLLIQLKDDNWSNSIKFKHQKLFNMSFFYSLNISFIFSLKAEALDDLLHIIFIFNWLNIDRASFNCCICPFYQKPCYKEATEKELWNLFVKWLFLLFLALIRLTTVSFVKICICCSSCSLFWSQWSFILSLAILAWASIIAWSKIFLAWLFFRIIYLCFRKFIQKLICFRDFDKSFTSLLQLFGRMSCPILVVDIRM
jgi:hypothetical protein